MKQQDLAVRGQARPGGFAVPRK